MAEDFEKWEIAVAKNVVSSFLKSNSIREYNFNDLLQECLLHWYQKRGKYRSDRKATRQTFMGHILRRRLLEILREQEADKRRVNQVAEPLIVTFDEGESDGDTYDLSDRKQEEEFQLSQRNFGLKKDVGDAMSKLSSSERKVCHLIMEGYPMTYISKILHKPRTTLYDEIERIRRIFLDEGLKEYLQ